MSVVKSLIATSLAFGLVSLLGCSSSAPDQSSPILSALSHTSDVKVTGDRNITFSVTATDNRTVTSVVINFNSTSQTVTQSGDVYSVTLALNDNTDNVINIVATDSSDNITNQSIILDYPYFRFTDGQPASVVIGQQNFDSGSANQGGAVGTNTLNRVLGRHIVINGILYIADTYNNRILGYNTIPTGPNAVADFIIGQPNSTSTTPGIENNQLDLPMSIATDGTKFIVSLSGDTNNSTNKGRVHIWNSIPISNVPADVVIGQPGFGQNDTNTCTNNRIAQAHDVFVVDGKMLIADRLQNRILIWDQIPTDSNQAANTVLGQVNFTNCEANDIDGDGSEDGPTASTFVKPSGIWSDGTRLIVADSGNQRVLIWDDFPVQGDIAADRVLGQINLVSDVTIFPMSTISDVDFNVSNVTANANQIFIADGHARILVWNSWPIADNAPAEQVLGSDNFDTVVSGVTQSTFAGAKGIYLNGNQLFVSDHSSNGNRVLIFEAP